jgi:hypothetical protein
LTLMARMRVWPNCRNAGDAVPLKRGRDLSQIKEVASPDGYKGNVRIVGWVTTGLADFLRRPPLALFGNHVANEWRRSRYRTIVLLRPA